jgi:uncharacterized membrane protein
MELGENKTAMGLIAIMLILFAVAIFFYNRTLNDLAAGSCSDTAGPACPHEKVVETQNIVIAVLILVIALIVGWIFLQMRKKPEPERGEKMAAPERKQTKKIDVSSLDSDEKKIIGILQEKGGSAFQSDVVKELGYSKVKVSRLLDRLEQKGMVERKRRGMANLVVIR